MVSAIRQQFRQCLLHLLGITRIVKPIVVPVDLHNIGARCRTLRLGLRCRLSYLLPKTRQPCIVLRTRSEEFIQCRVIRRCQSRIRGFLEAGALTTSQRAGHSLC